MAWQPAPRHNSKYNNGSMLPASFDLTQDALGNSNTTVKQQTARPGLLHTRCEQLQATVACGNASNTQYKSCGQARPLVESGLAESRHEAPTFRPHLLHTRSPTTTQAPGCRLPQLVEAAVTRGPAQAARPTPSTPPQSPTCALTPACQRAPRVCAMCVCVCTLHCQEQWVCIGHNQSRWVACTVSIHHKCVAVCRTCSNSGSSCWGVKQRVHADNMCVRDPREPLQSDMHWANGVLQLTRVHARKSKGMP